MPSGTRPKSHSLLRDYRAVGELLWPHFAGGKDGVLWYYRALMTAYRQTGANELVEELDRVVSEIERLASVSAVGLFSIV